MRTGIIYSADYLLHDMGFSHPENKERLNAIMNLLKDEMKSNSNLIAIEPRSASIDEINLVHSSGYINFIKDICERGGGMLDADTSVCSSSYKSACLAVGGVLSAIDSVMQKEIDNAICLVRPPGHHSLPDRAMGFCIFNNVAVGAKYAQKKYSNIKKVLIVDWDVHHGNGTQEMFYDDDTTLYFSIHQYPYYPGTGHYSEIGRGKGAGFTLNAPMLAGCGDSDYAKIFEEILLPIALQFNPDLILISAGFDAHQNDPLAGMQLTTRFYGYLTNVIQKIAERCNGRIVSTLEGGYDLKSLAESVLMHIRALQGESFLPPSELPNNKTKNLIELIKKAQMKFWDI